MHKSPIMRLPIHDSTDIHELAPSTHPLDGAIVATLRADLPDLRAVYRYGSAGSIHEREDSDLDIAILAGHPLSFEEQCRLAADLMRVSERDVDLNDLRRLPVTLRVQIVTGGIRLYAADTAAAEEYDSRTLSDYTRLNEERRGILDDIQHRGRIYG
ncbi:MAG: nucleotidyltransferase domain-containing protein [Betaproteobacteria bacterium]|nr:nucleotidyltransferase domain-containing protein [Betaproteobacteria bacterium]